MKHDKDQLGNRMKMYEKIGEAPLIPLVPVMARLDGKCFSKFTKGLKHPYDERMSELMVSVATYLVEETNACIGYTQSDEITLVWLTDNFKSEIFMGGRSSKMISILAAMASTFFNSKLEEFLPEKSDKMPIFDCRVWNLPTKTEAINALVWREQDATRNSIQMAGQSVYSHKQLMHKSCNEIQEMLFQKEINWNDYPAFFKRGVYVQRRTVDKKFTTEELDRLPLKHEARLNPDLVITRHEVRCIDMPTLTTVINREEVVFNGSDPEVLDVSD